MERSPELARALNWLDRLADCADADELGARLADLAAHSSSPIAQGAWLLRLTDDTDSFEVEHATGAAERLAGARAHPAREAPSERIAIPLAVLDAVPLAAWRDRGTAFGASGERMPWSGAERIGAFHYRIGAEAWLLVAALGASEAEPQPVAFASLAGVAQVAARELESREAARRGARQRAALIAQSRLALGSPHLVDALRSSLNAALQGTLAEGAAFWRATPGGSPRLELTAGALAERESLARALDPLVERMVDQGRARYFDEPLEDSGLAAESAGRFARIACVPVLGRERALGVLALFDTPGARHARFASSDHELIRALAEGLGALLEQAECGDALRRMEAQLAEARARLRRRERLATLGEIAGRLAREARHPLASIGAFARRAHRELPGADPNREYIEVVIRETERLEKMLGEPLELAAAEPGTLQLESVNAVIQEVLPGVGEQLVRRRVRLLKRLDPESPILLLDAPRMRQVLANLLEHAVETVPVGGRVRVESRLARDHVVVEISYDARREPGGLIEPLFVPFRPAAGAPGGPALHVADQIVRRHGGEIRVRSDSEWGATVMLTLPVLENGDRRQAGPDRRGSARDRRHRGVEA